MWNSGVVGETYDMFEASLLYKEQICYVSYDDIVNNPNDTIKKIYDYLNLDYFNHKYNKINTNINDNDEYWQIKNLHTIRNKLNFEYKNPYDYMDFQLVEDFKSYNKIFNSIEKNYVSKITD